MIGLKKKSGKLDFIYKLNDLFDRKEKIQFAIVMVMALLMAIFQAVGVASILPFINMVMNPNVIVESKWLNYFFQEFNFKTTDSFIIFSGFFVLGLLIIGNAVSTFAIWLRIHFAWKKNHTLSSALLQKYISMPYIFFLQENTAELGKNVLAEVQQLTNNFLLPLIAIVTNSIIAIVIFVLLIYVNPVMTLVAFAVIFLLYSLIYFHLSNNLRIRGKERLQENMIRYKTASEALGGIKDIKILEVERYFLQKFNRHSDKFSYLQAWNQVIGQAPRYAMEVLAFGSIVGLLIFSISSGMSTQKIIPLVSFFAFAGYRLMPAFQETFNSLATIKFNKAVLDKIHEDMLNGIPAAKNIFQERKKVKSISFDKKIELNNVSFSYPGNEKKILKNISLEINKNSCVALIGSTGSGKTTLVDLILGLLSPVEGKLKVDGVEINEENIKNWQTNLGYVPQQIYLTDDTVARNIAFGLPDEDIDLNRLKEVSRMANIDDFIENDLSSGYETVIGERGIRLSGGQRQRIGIARALYHNPQVLLLDEATSSLDNATEKEVLKAIESVAKLKTMIVIAHRLTTVKNCNKVYLMEKGEIIRGGSYNEIVSRQD